MKTLWGDIPVADAHVHFFSHAFFAALAAQVFVVRPPQGTPTGRFLGTAHLQRLLQAVDCTVLVAASLALVLTGCAGLDPACAPGLQAMKQAQLFFGRNIAGRGMVSEEEWRRFLDEEVTSRFPAGFSVADLDGQYRNAAGAIALLDHGYVN